MFVFGAVNSLKNAVAKNLAKNYFWVGGIWLGLKCIGNHCLSVCGFFVMVVLTWLDCDEASLYDYLPNGENLHR